MTWIREGSEKVFFYRNPFQNVATSSQSAGTGLSLTAPWRCRQDNGRKEWWLFGKTVRDKNRSFYFKGIFIPGILQLAKQPALAVSLEFPG